MQVTLHLTQSCNLKCRYCYVEKNNSICMDKINNIQNMDIESAKKSIDLASILNDKYVPVVFFGGEPLLFKDLIKDIIHYSKEITKSTGKIFTFKVVTNGTLLDNEFIEYSVKEGLFISISLDGTKEAHDTNRIYKDGSGSYKDIASNLDKLLYYFPYTPVMQVVDTNTIHFYYESVKNLFSLGFRFVISTINYSGSWNESYMNILKKQYLKLSDLYYEKTTMEDKFYFSPFDTKINSYIKGSDRCKADCSLGNENISIGPDGSIYPCTQFVGDNNYIIGDVEKGIDNDRRNVINKKGDSPKPLCSKCQFVNRCISYCSCLNKQTTGRIDEISPVICHHEKILIPIADNLAGKLYKKKNGMFIQKHYGDLYPVLSIIEDSLLKIKT